MRAPPNHFQIIRKGCDFIFFEYFTSVPESVRLPSRTGEFFFFMIQQTERSTGTYLRQYPSMDFHFLTNLKVLHRSKYRESSIHRRWRITDSRDNLPFRSKVFSFLCPLSFPFPMVLVNLLLFIPEASWFISHILLQTFWCLAKVCALLRIWKYVHNLCEGGLGGTSLWDAFFLPRPVLMTSLQGLTGRFRLMPHISTIVVFSSLANWGVFSTIQCWKHSSVWREYGLKGTLYKNPLLMIVGWYLWTWLDILAGQNYQMPVETMRQRSEKKTHSRVSDDESSTI